MRKSLLLAWMILSIPLLVFCQSRQVTGTVTDDKGDPLPNVSVLQKGTNSGVVTDSKGNFVINVSGSSPVLVFSFTGRQSEELTVGNSSNYNLSLSPGGTMSEVVVTALGIRRNERALGYSTQEVKGENLTIAKEQNVLGALAGKVAGVQVVGASGASMGGTQKNKHSRRQFNNRIQPATYGN